KFDLLAISTHTDDWLENWEATIVTDYLTIPELREKRGY
ncbi:unnamed protein product, partial [marine sediment metagenome]